MSTYHFTIVVRDAYVDMPDIEDTFYEAGCDDALLCHYNDTVYLEFDREADNAEQAIKSALENIRFEARSTPKPVYGVATGSALYSWAEVAEWLYKQGKLVQTQYEVARVVLE